MIRWRTYNRLADKCEAYEADCDAHLALLMGRLLKLG